MSTRTFRQMGHGYLSSSVSITAKIDGNVIYSGSIPSTDALIPSGPIDATTFARDVIFSWQKPVEFSGTQQLEISVAGGALLLCDTVADFVDAGNSSSFGGFYSYTDEDGDLVTDPFTNEAIDGVILQHPSVSRTLKGQWWWVINDGSVFTTTVNIDAGVPPAA